MAPLPSLDGGPCRRHCSPLTQAAFVSPTPHAGQRRPRRPVCAVDVTDWAGGCCVVELQMLLDMHHHQTSIEAEFQPRNPLIVTCSLVCVHNKLQDAARHVLHKSSYAGSGAPLQIGNPALQNFWTALTSVEEVLNVGTAELLKLPAGVAFPQEGSNVTDKLLVRQCYVELRELTMAHFSSGGRSMIITGNPG